MKKTRKWLLGCTCLWCLVGCTAVLAKGTPAQKITPAQKSTPAQTSPPVAATATVGTSPADERVTLNFRAAPIAEVFQVLSLKNKANIILGKGVIGDISVNLYNVTVPEAIYQIAAAGGYAVDERDGAFFIVVSKDAGQQTMQLRSFKVQYSDPAQVATILSKYLSSAGKVQPMITRRMIVVEDRPEFVARAAKLLEELDREPKQVLIEARILEVTLGDDEAYGVNWNRILNGTTTTRFGTNGLTKGTVAAGPTLPGLFVSLKNNNLELFLEAEANRSRVRTLSSPKLLALENQESKVVIGNSTGYMVTTTINQVTTQSISFLESGIILRVTPSVDELGRVMLKVHPEISTATVTNGIPAKKSTEVTTEFLCADGQSVFIGGLLKQASTTNKSGVPVLGDIPLVGLLFSSTTTNVSHTETVVILTPKIVHSTGVDTMESVQGVKQANAASGMINEGQLKLDPKLYQEQRDIINPTATGVQ